MRAGWFCRDIPVGYWQEMLQNKLGKYLDSVVVLIVSFASESDPIRHQSITNLSSIGSCFVTPFSQQ